VLLPRVQRALGELERALDDSRAERDAGPLRVSMLSSFLHHWLMPRLPRLRSQHPHIDLHIDTSTRLIDFVREDQHAAIRMGNGGWPNVHEEKLLDEWLIPVCTPALYAKHGPVNDADDLARYTLVHSTTEPWTAWLLAGRMVDDSSSPVSGARIDDSSAIVRFALQGSGLALARWSLVAEEIAAGQLVIASPKPVRYPRSYWFICPQRAQAMDTLMGFRDWLRAEMAAFPPPPGAGCSGPTTPPSGC
jgi:LysR family glycine cleavage system transcriptional activator